MHRQLLAPLENLPAFREYSLNSQAQPAEFARYTPVLPLTLKAGVAWTECYDIGHPA
ncbi:hypothetical protein PAXRUDRAFT_10640 [Paxillus rubicundulus Ve08.2h10]|uniref:Uncharacterized protein n=1 Tax=Paxillus rubicundulus Ve08.2h10 TaxID=930991 RepID=A0A0D0E5N4_9AGAM|nr:hypothetical protein PAXRUDRAFT_10640 [Paxillus rubicundulus Ve08.2h10]